VYKSETRVLPSPFLTVAGGKTNGKYVETCFSCRDKIFSSAVTRMDSTSGLFISDSFFIRETLGKRKHDNRMRSDGGKNDICPAMQLHKCK
jgi:hypothetical protein